MEDKCKSNLKKMLGYYYLVEDSNQFIDEELRVDLQIFYKNILIAGIQVKPSSFLNMRENVTEFNKNTNKAYGKPVFYVYYDYDTERFLNLENTIKEIMEALL